MIKLFIAVLMVCIVLLFRNGWLTTGEIADSLSYNRTATATMEETMPITVNDEPVIIPDGSAGITVDDSSLIKWTIQNPNDIVFTTAKGEIRIHGDTGHVDIPDGMTLDEASRLFWESLDEAYGIIRNQIERDKHVLDPYTNDGYHFLDPYTNDGYHFLDPYTNDGYIDLSDTVSADKRREEE